ncbi:hypothetical protein [Vibrio sp.]|uniref:hypothetical protein n=1 Tax=Vibrio sp. TaxID=678 RepID=UPI003D0DFC97
MELSIFDLITVKLTGAKDKAQMIEEMGRLLQQDMPLTDVARDFETFGSTLEKMVGKRLRIASDNGIAIHLAFEGIISDTAFETMKAGEAAGDMVEAFDKTKIAIQNSEGLFGMLLMSFVIPILKFLALALAIGFLGEYIFSMLKDLSPYGRWPGLSQVFYGYVSFIYQNWVAIIGSVVGLFVTVHLVKSKMTGGLRNYIDVLPFFKQYRLLTAGATLNALATLIHSDIALLKAIEILQSKAEPYSKWHLGMIELNIQKARSGGSLGQMLDTGLINEREVNRLSRTISDNELGDRIMHSSDEHNYLLKKQTERINYWMKIAFMVLLFSHIILLFASVMFLILSIQTN